MKSVLLFALFLTVARAMPQRIPVQQVPDQEVDGNNSISAGNNGFFPDNDNNNNANNGSLVTTTAAPTSTVTTASPRYLSCVRSCPSTMEYNPICGSDGENYHNNGRLSCAQRCGKSVSALRMGTCRPL